MSKLSKEKDERKKRSVQVSGSIPPGDYGKMKKLIDEGKYTGKGDFVRVAIRKLIAEEIGGVEIDDDALKVIRKAFGLTK
jgi:Arc/MetJ-type ribon-helix-helix transcriptional regulator